MSTQSTSKQIFPPFNFSSWKAIDDRVRGGSSISHLDPISVNVSGKDIKAARFWGHLDIKSLGGAGFASQRYSFTPYPLNLPRHLFSGLKLTLLPPSSSSPLTPYPSVQPTTSPKTPNTFTVVLKNSPSDPEERSSLSYESNFTYPSKSDRRSQNDQNEKQQEEETIEIYLPWTGFTPFYRGREVPKDNDRYKPLTEEVYELSLMCRSSFGAQEGDFEVVLISVEGVKCATEKVVGVGRGGWFGWVWSIWGWVVSLFKGRVRLEDDQV